MIINVVNALGIKVIQISNYFGAFTIFLFDALKTLFTTKLKLNKVLVQMDRIGVNSFVIVVLTGTFAGAVLALQSYIGLHRFGTEEFIGPLVALSMTREIGPVFTGLMVTGRAGSAIAAELGTMRITEQIDALITLLINPFQYLVVPRIVASTIILPFLTVFCMIFGIIGGYLVSVYVLGLNGEQYLSEIRKYTELSDITGGLIKAAVFGLILSWVGSFKGYTTRGGARGVGLSTTQSVVIGSIIILVANYFLAALLFQE